MPEYLSAYGLKSFYASRAGRLVRRLLLSHIRRIWPDMKGLRVMGYGYAVPYLRPLMEGAERVFAVMPAHGGAHVWPDGEKGLVCLSGEYRFPVETESIDRLILIHSLEHTPLPDELLQEVWRVLKSNGRLLLVVPNRLGLWARADWTPFGYGSPFTAGQIVSRLEEQLFVHERTERALFMPPFRSFLMLRAAYALESFGRFAFPGLAGVYLVEAGKQVYAGAHRGRRAESQTQAKRRMVATRPVSAGG